MEKDSSADVVRVKREYLSGTDDEISLIELWMILVKRWKVVAVVFSLFLVIGVVAAFSSPLKYQFSTTVNIGSFEDGNGVRTLLEPLKTVQEKLKSDYIRNVVDEFRTANDMPALSIDAKALGEGVVLTSEGNVQDNAAIKKMHLSIADRVVGDHKLLANNRMKLVEQRVRQESEQLRLATEFKKALESRQNELLSSSGQLQAELNAARMHIAEVANGHESGFSGRAQENYMFKALMVSQELERLEARLLVLESRLYVAIPQELVKLKKVLMDNHADVVQIQLSLGAIKMQMATQVPTESVSLAVRATKPSGIGRGAMVVLSILMGLFVSVLGVFICEFISKANTTMRNVNGA